MKYTFEIAACTLKKKGFFRAIGVSCLIIRSRLIRQHRPVFRLTASVSESISPIEVPGYKIELMRPDQADSISTELSQCQQQLDWDINTKLKEGADVWVGRLDGRLATIAVTKTGDKKHRYFFPLTSNCVVISHCVTVRSCRGLGLYPASLVYIVVRLAEKGIHRFYIDSADWNTPSISGIRRAGFQLIGKGIVSKSGRLIWCPQ